MTIDLSKAHTARPVMFRPLLPIILIVMPPALMGQDPAAFMRLGDSALHAGLWETAALHYDSALAVKNLGAQAKSNISIRLAEAWIRDGKSTAALDLLGRSFVSRHPDAPFWKGIALLGTGRLTDALTSLTAILENPDSRFRKEAGLTIGNIQLALGKPDDALATLDTLAADPDSQHGASARLRKIEILLDMGKHAEALAIMPDVASLTSAERPVAAFLSARLQLAAGDFPAAITGFQTLLDQPRGQTSQHHHLAAIGFADALLGSRRPTEAAAFLTSFIEANPESPYLSAWFTRLLKCLPEKPVSTDPVLEKLAEWVPPCQSPAAGALTDLNQSAESAFPGEPAAITGLQGEAMLARASGLRRVGTPETCAQSRLLLERVRLELPGSPLADRALLETVRSRMEAGRTDLAMDLLDTLRETACSGETRGRAAFDQAAQAYQRGGHKLARELFDLAAATLDRADADAARFNAAIVTLSSPPGTMTVVQSKNPPDTPATADLELERARSTPEPEARRVAIEEFLTKHPEHPRVSEARLAAAEAALITPRPDLSFARAQLDTIEASPEKAGDIAPSRIAWLRLRILDLDVDPAATVEAARGFLRDYPADPMVPDATFILGRHLFEIRSYNDARLLLEKLAASEPDSPLAQASWLLAARSAALVRTSQSQQEALILFDKIIRLEDSAVAPLAMLEKGQLLIDMNRMEDAAVFLKKWFDSLKPTDPLHMPAGLLLGEAIYAQGSANPASLTDALAVYDKLLVQTENDGSLFNRIQYLRGKTLEQLTDSKDPSRKREKDAFIAYYSVLEKSDTPAEWHYFELCGFRAVALLEKAGRWPAAIACSKKIASFKGPRAAEAATHASQLQLKHMIWED
jgi:tetratricopeptide (TPR) repeat protein